MSKTQNWWLKFKCKDCFINSPDCPYRESKKGDNSRACSLYLKARQEFPEVK